MFMKNNCVYTYHCVVTLFARNVLVVNNFVQGIHHNLISHQITHKFLEELLRFERIR